MVHRMMVVLVTVGVSHQEETEEVIGATEETEVVIEGDIDVITTQVVVLVAAEDKMTAFALTGGTEENVIMVKVADSNMGMPQEKG